MISNGRKRRFIAITVSILIHGLVLAILAERAVTAARQQAGSAASSTVRLSFLQPVADLSPLPTLPFSPLSLHNPDATFTTRGCIRACPFCTVPRTEGRFVELQDWTV